MKKAIIQRVAKEFRVGVKSLRIGEKQTRDVIEARYAYAVVLMVMGEDVRSELMRELEMREPVAVDYELRSEEYFRLSKQFRRQVEEITKKLGVDGRFDKYASAHPAKIDKWLQVLAEPKAPKRAELLRSKRGKTLHSFDFTVGEEAAMQRACEEAEEWMNGYGKGYEYMPIVDRKHYCNS